MACRNVVSVEGEGGRGRGGGGGGHNSNNKKKFVKIPGTVDSCHTT